MQIQTDPAQVRHIRQHVLRDQPHQHPHRPIGAQQAKQAAGNHQHQRLRQKLTHQPRPRCSQRTSHRDLPLPALRSHQQQARYIHAGNHQQQSRTAKQYQQYRTNVSNDLFVQRLHGGSLVTIRARILHFELLRNRSHIRQGSLHRHPILQSPHAVKIVAAPSLLAAGQRMLRRPELGLAFRCKLKIFWKHPDNCVRRSAQLNRLPDHILPSAKPLLPCRIGKDHVVRRARLILAVIEIPPQHRLHAQHPEESSAHPRAANRFRAGRSAQQVTRPRISLQRTEHRVHLLPVDIILVRQVRSRKHLRPLSHIDQPRRILIRKRLDQRGIDKREDSYARADSQCQHQEPPSP